MRLRSSEMGEIETGDDPTVVEADGDVTVSLWTKKGRRLYLNDFGPSSANRYIDLDAGTVEGGYSNGFDVDVDNDAGMLTILGCGSTIVVDLDRNTTKEDDSDDETDSIKQDRSDVGLETVATESREMATALAGDAAGQHGFPPNLPRESAMAGLGRSLDKPDGNAPLESGDVFYRTTSVIGDGDGYHVVYLNSGTVAALSGFTSSTTDSKLRDDLHTGILKRVSVEELSDEQRAARIERMESERDSLESLAADRREAGDDDRYIERLESERDALVAAIEADE